MTLILKFFKWLFAGHVGLIVVALVGGRIFQVMSESEDLARYLEVPLHCLGALAIIAERLPPPGAEGH